MMNAQAPNDERNASLPGPNAAVGGHLSHSGFVIPRGIWVPGYFVIS